MDGPISQQVSGSWQLTVNLTSFAKPVIFLNILQAVARKVTSS